MTFLESVNRLLRVTTLLQWDDDNITSFTQTQHAGTISLARQAIQFVTNELVADKFLWPEDKTAELTFSTDTRTYSLASDFVRFDGKRPWLFELTGASGTDATSQFISEYTGGRDRLQKDVPAYTSQTGTPQWWYFTDDQEIGIYPVPSKNGTLYRYDYQKDVMPENESDSLPVQSDQMGYAFTDMAARVFTFLFTSQVIPQDLGSDLVYKTAKASLFALQRKQDPISRYGHRYSVSG